MYIFGFQKEKARKQNIVFFFFCLDAVRTRYRISKYFYSSFYKERIQETLSGCIYNEGTRKQKKQTMQVQAQNEQENIQQDAPEIEE